MESDLSSRIFVLLFLALTIVGVASLLNTYALERGEYQHAILVLDKIGVGQHHLNGTVVLPSPCHRFALQVTKHSESAQHLSFKTWYDAARICPEAPSEYSFQAVVFAASFGTTFTADIDGAPVPMHVIRAY